MSTATALPPAAPPAPVRRRPLLVPVGAAVALALWGWSLTDVRLEETSGWGLLPALPLTWYLASAAVVLLYTGALLSRRPVGHGLVVPQIALVAMLFGTTSAVYEVARYPWTFKHVGVVEYVLENWSVDRSIDIYHNFPGFFFVTAGVARATGLDPLTLAQWAQPVFALLSAAAVYWAVGALSSSLRVRYAAVLLFTLGDWIGQNYFAPQGLAFPVALFVLGGLLRSASRADGLRSGLLRRWFPPGDEEDRPRQARFWTTWAGSALLVLGYAFVAVTHPLTPLVLLAQSVLVAVLLRPARPWLVLVFLAVEVAWLVQALPFLTSTYDLFDFGLDNIDPPQVSIVDPLPGYETALWAAPLLMAVVALLTAVSLVLALRRPGRTARFVVPLAIAAVPTVMILGQPYGNEGVFRAYLFALPWLAFVIGLTLFTRPPGLRGALRPVPVLLIAVLTLPANFAGEMSYRVAASDVAADVWFEQNAPPGSVLLPFTSSYPWRTTADYADHLPLPTEAVIGLVEVPGFAEAAGDQTDLVEFTEDVCDTRPGTGPVYVATGPSAVDNVRLFGTMQLYTYRAFERELAADPDFTEVFREGESVLFRCRD